MIAGVAVLLAYSLLILDAAMLRFEVGGVLSFLALVYPAGDVVMIALALSAVGRTHEQDRLPVMLMSAAAAVHLITESVYSLMIVAGTYQTGSLLDVGWFAAFLLLWLAAHHLPTDAAQPRGPHGSRPTSPRSATRSRAGPAGCRKPGMGAKGIFTHTVCRQSQE